MQGLLTTISVNDCCVANVTIIVEQQAIRNVINTNKRMAGVTAQSGHDQHR